MGQKQTHNSKLRAGHKYLPFYGTWWHLLFGITQCLTGCTAGRTFGHIGKAAVKGKPLNRKDKCIKDNAVTWPYRSYSYEGTLPKGREGFAEG